MKGAAAYRSAISAQIRTARAAWPETVTCARCAAIIPKASAHADHYPVPFAALVREYLDCVQLGLIAATRETWQAFHATEAQVTPSCAECNIAANPRGIAWHQRRRAIW